MTRRRRWAALLAAGAACAGARAAPAQAPAWQPHLSVHLGTPQGASLGLGVLRVVERAPDFTSVSGPRIVLEPGLLAGKVRLGWTRTGAFATGWAVEGAVLRIWDAEHALYGAEVHGTFVFIDAALGAFAGPGARRLAFSLGLSL